MTETRIKVQNYTHFRDQLGVSRSTFFKLLREDPNFPRPFKVGGRNVLYVHECDEYVRQCAERSR